MKKSNIKSIDIPNKCTKHNFEFTKVQDGNHCANCEKLVVDFSNFTTQEIIDYFEKKKEGEFLCGSFNSKQLADVNAHLLPQQNNRKHFLAILFTSFLTLSSCHSFKEYLQQDYSPTDRYYRFGSEKFNKNTESNESERPKYHSFEIIDNLNAEESNYIKGKVIDFNFGDELPFVNVYLSNSKIKTKTDFDGNFKIEYDNQSKFLVIEYWGYNTYKIQIDALIGKEINVKLIENAKLLDDVIIIGQVIHQKKRNFKSYINDFKNIFKV